MTDKKPQTVILSVQVESTQRVRDLAKNLRRLLAENPLDDTKIVQVQYNLAQAPRAPKNAARTRRR